jgi:hypothetical protein
VPGGLAFSEFRGYEAWQLVSISQDGPLIAAIPRQSAMIAAYTRGCSRETASRSDGAKMAKIHWDPDEAGDVPRRGRCRRPSMTSTSW